MKTIITTILIALTLFTSTSGNSQETLEHGHGALQLFDEQGIANTPRWVMLWIYFMMLSFAGSLVFVKNHLEARWVTGSFVVGVIIMLAATRIFDVLPLSGFIALVHLIAWTPALIVLLKNRPFMKPVSAFSIWSGVMTFVILFSFVFDIRDAAIYLHSLLG